MRVNPGHSVSLPWPMAKGTIGSGLGDRWNLLNAAALFAVLGMFGCQRGGSEQTHDLSPDTAVEQDAFDVGRGEVGPGDVEQGDVPADVSRPEFVTVRVTLERQPAAESIVIQGGAGVHGWCLDDGKQRSFNSSVAARTLASARRVPG